MRLGSRSDSSAFLQAVLMASKRGSVVQMLPAATPGWGRAKRAVRKVTSRFSDMKAPERGESLLMRLATPPRRLSTNDVGAHGADTPRGSGGVMGAGAMGEGTVAGGEEVVLVQGESPHPPWFCGWHTAGIQTKR